MIDPNHKRFESSRVVFEYRFRNRGLRPPEAAILGSFERELPAMRVLDLGVGTGRTTAWFLERGVAEYVGVDYSARMIDACRRRFPGATFLHADARALDGLDDHHFDLVVFSFNGLDHVDHDDRLRILREIRRVARHGARFVFSAHNLRSIYADVRSVVASTSGLPRISALARHLLIRSRNRGLGVRLAADHVLIREVHRMTIYYLLPETQVRQLRDAGFVDARVFSLGSGAELCDPAALRANEEPYLYYLCTCLAEEGAATARAIGSGGP
jgi:SAM-dependent methyltransferase